MDRVLPALISTNTAAPNNSHTPPSVRAGSSIARRGKSFGPPTACACSKCAAADLTSHLPRRHWLPTRLAGVNRQTPAPPMNHYSPAEWALGAVVSDTMAQSALAKLSGHGDAANLVTSYA